MAVRSVSAQWVDDLPAEAFFRSGDVPGASRGAVRSFLNREASRAVPRLMRVAPNLYYKPRGPSRFTGEVHPPGWVSIGWEIAGPHAAALGWHGANIVRWSTQVALQRLQFAVPGEPPQRRPHPRIVIRSRRNMARRELTRFEATHLEAVIGFDRWCEISWDEALELSEFHLGRRAARDEALPRAEILERVAAGERPRGAGPFRQRMAELVELMDSVKAPAQAAVAAAP